MTEPQTKSGNAGSPEHPGSMNTRPWQATMKRLAPETQARMMRQYDVFMKPGPLSEALCHLIYVAIDSVPTHLYPPGVELHARGCMESGGTLDEVIEALEIASTVCDQTFKLALPIVHEECRRAGLVVPDVLRQLTSEEEKFKAAYIASAGSWPEWMDAVLRTSSEFFMRYCEVSHLGGPRQRLDPKSRALIFLAVSACPAILNAEGVRQHARRCIELGATTAELIAAVEQSSGLGIHAFSLGVPELDNALKNMQRS